MQQIDENALADASLNLRGLYERLCQVIFGQEELVEQLLLGVVARGHVLLEGLPGLGKTELVKSFAKAVTADVKRIQFTPDLLPGDITGNPVLQESSNGMEFVFRPGPLFANIVLADEINRASPKTQSSLLEAMQERRVTVGGTSHSLPEPFFVLATQNPIELEGTYPLPEAQVDRFLFKLEVKSVSSAVLERIISNREMGIEPEVQQVMTKEELQRYIQLARTIFLPDVVSNYIARLVYATQPEQSQCSKWIKYGASPRAALGFAAAVKARALLKGRINASYEDVRAVAVPVLQHRLILDYAAKIDGVTAQHTVAKLLEEVPTHNKPVPSSVQLVSTSEGTPS